MGHEKRSTLLSQRFHEIVPLRIIQYKSDYYTVLCSLTPSYRPLSPPPTVNIQTKPAKYTLCTTVYSVYGPALCTWIFAGGSKSVFRKRSGIRYIVKNKTFCVCLICISIVPGYNITVDDLGAFKD
jgi:hypothetical protein